MDFTRQAGNSTRDIAKMLEGTTYAGSGTKQEIVELENNLRQILQARMCPYSYVEDYLINCGYRQDMIRRAFEKVTGVSPHDFLKDDIEVLTVPACIPSYNLGWGESKAKKLDYYFIMPWVTGYSIFGQKGELGREEIKNFPCLDMAREHIKSLVKLYRQHDKVVDLPLKDNKGFSSFSEPRRASLSSDGKSIDEYLSCVGPETRKSQSESYIKDAYFSGLITQNDFHILSSKYISAADDAQQDKVAAADKDGELNNLEDSALVRNVDSEMREDSPQSFFDNYMKSKDGESLSPFIERIEKYLDSKASALSPDYSFQVLSIKYSVSEKFETGEKNVRTPTSSPMEPLGNTGIASVVLKLIPESQGESAGKYGLLVFKLVNGELQTTSNFKGSDHKLYAMDKDGVGKYLSDMESDALKNIF